MNYINQDVYGCVKKRMCINRDSILYDISRYSKAFTIQVLSLHQVLPPRCVTTLYANYKKLESFSGLIYFIEIIAYFH